ncbi:MAG: bifunctional nuclease family protein [Bacteroidales bacterium]
MMELIELEVADLQNSSTPSEAYVLVLKEKGGKRYIPIVIGLSEARSIVLELNKMKPRRPSPHDLFKSLADCCQMEVKRVVIYKYEEGIYFSDLYLEVNEDNKIHIDSRTSDAVVLALKFGVPIFIDPIVFKQNQIEMEEDGNSKQEQDEWFDSEQEEEETQKEYDRYLNEKLKEMSKEELQTLLDGAVESEDFELASKIHEEIKKRQI